MKFELELQNDLKQTKTISCDIFADWFHLGLMTTPQLTHWNVFHKHDALDRLYTIVEELDKKINTWNKIADAYKTDNIPLSEILGNIVMSSGNAFCKIDNKLEVFELLKVCETELGKFYAQRRKEQENLAKAKSKRGK